ncbi:hypothetical protein VNO78_05371 [Psophocarpus tetragonolobus]|uniref:Uncharacterized protein n=1 Tax=Psophocarpus tetragonolobus TaxID=3891 RepID=A0AAN9SS40_PSOTE
MSKHFRVLHHRLREVSLRKGKEHMGNICASNQYGSKGGKHHSWEWKSTVNIIELDGRLQQWKKAIKAWEVLSENPNCYICCSESMYVGSPMPPVPPTQDLQLGLIYFIVPLPKSRLPLSLQDLGALAIKANAALASATPNYPFASTSHQLFPPTHPLLSNVSLPLHFPTTVA